MSLIYQSLQQLNTRKNQARLAHQTEPPLKPTKHSRLLVTTGIGISLLFLLSGLGYSLLKSTLPDSDGHRTSSQETLTLKTNEQLERDEEKTKVSKSLPQLLRSTRLYTPHDQIAGKHRPETSQAGYLTEKKTPQDSDRQARDTLPAQPLTAPHQTNIAQDTTRNKNREHNPLQKHFHNKIEKNRTIQDIEHKIKAALQNGDLQKAQQHLNTLTQLLGGSDKLTVTQWKAVLAMSQQRFQQAEELFMQARSLDPQDVETNVNLALCLRAQGHNARARHIYEHLSQEHPLHHSVQELKTLF